ncbi:C4-dicarboxylate transporter/malic acid transport protein [Tricholoma matsutake]|nr:C4-dicarboxylate transporter/malic acid transport protein [Tricholoma matsutake 945]
MGTGAVSILFASFPYGHDTHAMNIFSLVFFFLNLFLVILFTALTFARYYLYPYIWPITLNHPVSSLYIGCFPMGVATLINVAVDVINTRYGFGGKVFLYFIWAVWWIDVLVSVLCCWGMVHVMQTTQTHSLQAMTTVWLLPVVTVIVASSSGGVLAGALQKYSPIHALISSTIAVFLVIVGLSLALMMLTTYLLRLIIYGPPSGATVLSTFLPLGPTGQAGFSVLLIGQNFKSLLPFQSDSGSSDFLQSSTSGVIVYNICVCISFLLWCIASMWIVYAFLAVQDVVRRGRFPFKLPWWGLVFPNGVYANLTINLSVTFDSRFFRIFGAIYAIGTLILWTFITTKSMVMVYDRTIFEALEDLDMVRPDKHSQESGQH